MADGAIYVATGANYVDLAIQSVRSLKATNPGIGADLFTDDLDRAGLDLFDRVETVPRIHSRAKLECLPLSRFDRTLFLDADTLVVGDLGDLWEIADRFDLALAHDVRRASDLIREGANTSTPYAFPQFNSGVMLYRNNPATDAFFADWSARFHASDSKRDQTILKDKLWDTDLRVYTLPPEFNLRRVTELDAWEPLDAEVKIIHSHRLMDHIRVPGATRISDLGALITAERQALANEWRAVGDPDRRAWFAATRGG